MTHRVRATLAGTFAGVLALLGTVLTLDPAGAAGASYVALGDSYSSGVGTRTYISDGTSCQRSTYAYPYLIAQSRGFTLNFQACSGAKIPDVTSKQLGALSSGTSYVTISVGGNDEQLKAQGAAMIERLAAEMNRIYAPTRYVIRG